MDATVEYYTDTAGAWRWRIRASNGEIIATSSEGYSERADAEHGYKLATGRP